jgi:phosphotransferase system HPr (HPr) family protein
MDAGQPEQVDRRAAGYFERLRPRVGQILYTPMKLSSVVVSSHPGITAAVAARLVRAVQKTQSIVLLRCGERMANAGNVFSLLALCAAMGATVEVQACGEDEVQAAGAVERILSEAA